MSDFIPSIEPVRDASLGFGLLPRFVCWWVRGPLWRLQEDYVFRLSGRRCMTVCPALTFRVPKGYEFDKASIPPLFWGTPFNYIPDGLCTVAALEHDFLCDLLTGGSAWLLDELGALPECPPARMIHEHFRLRLHECGVRAPKAEAMGRAVAALGPQGWAWPWVKALTGGFVLTLGWWFLNR